MSYVAVVPFTYPPFIQEFMATCKFPKEQMLVIDNSTAATNIGCMASHNKGIDFMKEKSADWLIVISPAIRFGEAGGLDFAEQLETCGLDIAHGVNLDAKENGSKVFGWHLVAFHKSIFEKIGRWDENFTPYGFDDVDMSLRIRRAIPDVKWEGLFCDVSDTEMGHSLKHNPDAVGEADSSPRILYFVEKWGRHPGAYQLGSYDTPFNNPEYDMKFWPPAKNGGKYDD